MLRKRIKYDKIGLNGGADMEYKIHVAFGFHVNCYHSYRGDTNDAQGFGSDIRIIRSIRKSLDTLNSEGIRGKGTGDSENLFSL